MTTVAEPQASRVAGFRTKLLVAMMLVVSVVTAFGLWFAGQNLAANAERDRQHAFASGLAALHNTQEIRHTALVELSSTLAHKSRFHAALEDDALDLLYRSARDELAYIRNPALNPAAGKSAAALHAEFYRFLGGNGAVIPPPPEFARETGPLPPATEARLALPSLPDQPQLGYLSLPLADGTTTISEVIALPIFSTSTGKANATLVLGFKPFQPASFDPSTLPPDADIIGGGIWLDGQLSLPHLSPAANAALATEVARALAASPASATGLRTAIDGAPYLLFFQQLNPGSLYPPAYEVCVYPLASLVARQRMLRWQILGVGTLLLLGGFGASHFLSRRLSAPVEQLAVDSERSARFSADASHQLKTPVTVLRAGLEELLARDQLSPEECQQISALIHQTWRLSSLIEDLLLLSRMDAGRLRLELAPVNLTQLIEGSLDDLGTMPDDLHLEFETAFPPDLHIAGEKRYTAIILQNLLENARKYNRPRGRIGITARIEGDAVLLTIGNTGRGIAPAAQAHIFERFHRGAIGENVPGYGLGLNLARELARLHQGDLRLVRSDAEWTEFEARFRLAPAPVPV